MFIGGPNQRKDYHIEEGEEVKDGSGHRCKWSIVNLYFINTLSAVLTVFYYHSLTTALHC